MPIRKPSCKCGKGLCCTVIAVNMGSINGDRQWVEGRKGKIIGNIAYLPSVCQWLDEKTKKCMVHGSKPEFCKNFPTGPAPWLINLGCKFYD